MSMQSSAGETPHAEIITKPNTQLLNAQVVVSLAAAVALAVFTVVQLLYRTTHRARRLWRGENQVRFDGALFLSKSTGHISRKIVEAGIVLDENKNIDLPPPVLPAVVANGRDARADCISMLAEVRKIFCKQYGDSANLMSMRSCLSCVESVLPSAQTEEFLRIYESVLFGQHRSNGSAEVVTISDIKFLHAFFHNTILKEIQ